MREEARHLLHEAIAAHGVAATARRLGVEDRRELVRSLVSRVEWDGERAVIFLREEENVPPGENSK